MSTVASLAVSVNARTANFRRGMKRAGGVVERFSRRVQTVSSKVLKLGGALAAISGGGLSVLTKQSIASIDAAAKTADKLGLTVEALTALRHAAELTGNSTQTLDMGLQRMTRRIAEAAQGTGEAKNALAELGLNAKSLASLSPDKQFSAIADAMEQVGSQSDRVRLGFKLFDAEGVSLINTLRGGSDALKHAITDARKLGLVFSEKDRAAVEKFTRAFRRMRASFRGLANSMAIRLAPMLERAGHIITGLAIRIRTMDAGLRQHIKQVIKWIAAIGSAIVFLPKLIAAVKGVITVIRALTKAAAALQAFSGLGLATLAAGAAAAASAVLAIDYAFDEIDDAVAKVIEDLEKLGGESGDVATEVGKIYRQFQKLQKLGGRGKYMEIDLQRTYVGRIRTAKQAVQNVNDPQLQKTNEILQAILKRLNPFQVLPPTVTS